jgi:hypothetical protein
LARFLGRHNALLTKSFLKFAVLFFILVSVSLIAVAVTAQDDAATQAKIASAMSAGPASITKDATIFDRKFDADGKYVVLRAGTNGWYCLPDIAASPEQDPQCLDQTWLDAVYAFRAGKPVVITNPGIAYMLAGGDHPSYTDPKAATPPTGENWHKSGPHLMVILPGADLSGGVTCTDSMMGADNSCVMFPDTPLAHLMVPIGDMGAMGAEATQASS